MSKAEILASLPEDQYQEIMSQLSDAEIEALNWDADFWLRPKQKMPEGEGYSTFALIAGRGFGKTRALSEWIRKKARENPGCKIILAGRTSAEIRNIIVDGVSGILAVSPPHERPKYKMHLGRLEWPNGTVGLLLSSESPDQARGISSSFAACDELAAWKSTPDSSGATLIDNIYAANRDKDGEMLIATTPKRSKQMKELMERAKNPDEKIYLVTGKTTDNKSLPQAYIDSIKRRYGDSKLAKQELEGQMLDDIEGVVFTDKMLESNQVDPNDLPKGLSVVISVDPTVSASSENSDECGIVVIGVTRELDPHDRTAYVLEDASGKMTPTEWAKRVSELSDKYNTLNVIAERNQGGALLEMVMKAENPDLRVYTVWASEGKRKRLESIEVKFEQGKVKFAGDYPELFDQMVMYDPDVKGYSPDRMDAAVHGFIAVLVDPPKGLRLGKYNVASPPKRNNQIRTGTTRRNGNSRFGISRGSRRR